MKINLVAIVISAIFLPLGCVSQKTQEASNTAVYPSYAEQLLPVWCDMLYDPGITEESRKLYLKYKDRCPTYEEDRERYDKSARESAAFRAGAADRVSRTVKVFDGHETTYCRLAGDLVEC